MALLLPRAGQVCSPLSCLPSLAEDRSLACGTARRLEPASRCPRCHTCSHDLCVCDGIFSELRCYKSRPVRWTRKQLFYACFSVLTLLRSKQSSQQRLLCTTNSRQIEFTTAVGALAKQSRKFAAQKQELALCRQHEPCAAHEDSAEAGDAHDEGRQEDQSRARAAEST
eukprot:15442-Heterococcus_DN1.PRE.3